MLKASRDEVMYLFDVVHAPLSSHCHAEIVYDDDGNIIGVACMKHGYESWRATLTELVADVLIMAGNGGE